MEARDSDAKEPEASLEEVADTRRQELDLFQIFLANSYYIYIYSYGKSQSSVGKSSINIGISISICYSFLEGTSMTRNMSDNNKKRRSPDEFIWAVDHFWWEVLFSEQIVTSTGGEPP